MPLESGCHVIEGEGGHADFAPIDSLEIDVLEQLTKRFGRVSVERLLSGSGLVNIYQTLATLSGKAAKLTTASLITSAP